jgi:succinate dehydrogenase / fumarate reductase, cytochrome b subunit
MNPTRKGFISSVGQKFTMAITGLGLIGFVIVHLLGNLNIYKSDPNAINNYAEALDKFGPLLTIAEIGLLVFFVVHIFTALSLKKNHWAARQIGYRKLKSKGGPSLSSPASRNMIVSGLVLLIFLFIHLYQFRFGPGVEAGYVTQVHGEAIWDLHRIVVEVFRKPLNVAFYVAAMGFLGMHLWHGFWSSFQSLGATSPISSRVIHLTGIVVAVILAAGFLFIPIFVYLSQQHGAL